MDKFTRIVSFLLLVASGIVFLQHRRMEHLADERDRYRRNNTALLSEVERLQLDSATMALDVKTLHLTIDEYKRFRAEDAATIEGRVNQQVQHYKKRLKKHSFGELKLSF